MAKEGILSPIDEPLHWLGWGITTATIILLIMFVFPVIQNFWVNSTILLLVIAVVDWIKHKIYLQ